MTQAFVTSRFKRYALGIGLCLLATLFALEAKWAGYGSPSGLLVQIQSAKARPADGPVVIARDAPAHSSAPTLMALTLLAAIGETTLMCVALSRRLTPAFRSRSVSSAPFFSSALFLRPPPALELL